MRWMIAGHMIWMPLNSGMSSGLIQADLTNEQDVSQMFSQHEGEPDFGPIHIVVINHGILPAAVSVAAMPIRLPRI